MVYGLWFMVCGLPCLPDRQAAADRIVACLLAAGWVVVGHYYSYPKLLVKL